MTTPKELAEAYAKGFADCREMAAQLVVERGFQIPSLAKLADRIRALHPTAATCATCNGNKRVHVPDWTGRESKPCPDCAEPATCARCGSNHRDPEHDGPCGECCAEPTPAERAPTVAAAGECQHPNAVDDGECNEGCCDCYRCPDCGERWKEEAPQ